MDKSIFEINENSEKRYMHGKINLAIRLYFYFKEGVNQITGLRTLGYVLIGIAGVLAIEGTGTNWWLIAGIGLVFIPPLTFFGWVWALRGRKTEEYLSVRYLSTYGRYGVQIQEEQMNLLREINENIKRLTTKVSDIQNGKFIQSNTFRAVGDKDVVGNIVLKSDDSL